MREWERRTIIASVHDARLADLGYAVAADDGETLARRRPRLGRVVHLGSGNRQVAISGKKMSVR